MTKRVLKGLCPLGEASTAWLHLWKGNAHHEQTANGEANRSSTAWLSTGQNDNWKIGIIFLPKGIRERKRSSQQSEAALNREKTVST